MIHELGIRKGEKKRKKWGSTIPFQGTPPITQRLPVRFHL
jgi:hypothetical protein